MRLHAVHVAPAVAGALLAGALLAACADAPSEPGVVAPRPSAPQSASVDCGEADVVVESAKQLETALHEAEAGDVIRIEPGRYEGEFVATEPGTAKHPIVLCGSSDAILDGGNVKGDYVLHLAGADYWHLVGFTVTNGQKGVMLDGVTGAVIEGLTVTKIGDEGIHLRDGSTDNLVTGNTVSDTGLRKEKFGEGIYVGTAESNWCDISDCDEDRSDRNVIENNVIRGTTAEAIDIKEGTSDGIVRNNTFDGSGLTGDADSWVDVKGNGWLIEGNTGESSPGDGFQTHEVVDGWGTDNVFRGNTAKVHGPGFGFALTPVQGNSVSCDNTATGAESGLTNASCDQ